MVNRGDLVNGPNSGLWSNPGLIDRIVCPACKHQIIWNSLAGECQACRRKFPIEDGIPILLRDRTLAGGDEIEHEHLGYKQAQATYFDREIMARFERDRPRGAPALHRWLLEKKFLIGTRAVSSMLPGSTVLVVCGGSGMDGDFLAQVGARVITSDISLGAAQRAAERATTYGLQYGSIVADIEELPIMDRGVDVAYVHDGLHHLASPLIGLAEMIRVTSIAMVVTEPAKARLTRLAMKVGLALEFEDAGNRVERMEAKAIGARLEENGFKILTSRRYAMFYRHRPGAPTRALSLPGLLSLAKLVSLAGIRVSGRFGNKLTVQAARDRGDSTGASTGLHQSQKDSTHARA